MGLMIKLRKTPKPTCISLKALYDYISYMPENTQISYEDMERIFKQVYLIEHKEEY